MLSAFVNDGYTREGRICEVPRVHPEICFSYRPMAASDIAEHTTKTKNATDAEWHKAVAAILAKKIITWDVRTATGEAVEVNADNLMRIVEPAFLRLWQCVSGSAGDDGEDQKN